jgi:ribosome recycling factor
MVREIIASAKPKMDKALDHFVHDLASLRTGRASIAILDSVTVDAYGTPQPLKAVAQLSTPDARSLAITPWDKSLVGPIEKAIRENQSLGLNPMNDGSTVRIAIPPLTEERRREIVKTLGTKVEDCRIALRNVRHDVLSEVKKLEKAKEATTDDVKYADTEMGKLMDTYQKRIQELEAAKAKEIMEV